MWTAADIKLNLDEVGSQGVVVTVSITTPLGDFSIMGEIEQFDHELQLVRVHIQSEGVWRNSLGPARLRQIARVVAEIINVEFVTIKGAARTTGSNVGRIPRPIRFAREVPPPR
ncbi:MAG TPA: hypothetical protein VHW90_10555 [Stellaceae bacterium]|jgi:hypothetical protein|nr:hypothetical protein [Stellaceae bacterium]